VCNTIIMERKEVATMIYGYKVTFMIMAAVKTGLIEALYDVKDKGDTVEGLATKLKADVESLHRLLRALVAYGVVDVSSVEEDKSSFALSKAGEFLSDHSGGSLKASAIQGGQHYFHQAWAGLDQSVLNGTTAFDEVHGCGLFDFLTKNDEAREVFNAKSAGLLYFKELSQSAIEFSKYKTVVDVGGGQGHFLLQLVKEHAEQRVILFDLPEVIEKAKTSALWKDVEDKCKSRAKMIGGSFFDRIPVQCASDKEGDTLVIMKQILHDWNDENCKKIIARCYDIIPKGGHLAIIDLVIPEQESQVTQSQALMDLTMMVIGGKERTLSDFQKLLTQAGFSFLNLYPTKSWFSIVLARKD
jgi:2-polyprenyl-3-methyl-5-hydroxy-6-metoxy-1,4-benzoquinol methylase